MPWQEVGVKLGDADVRMTEHARALEQVRDGAQEVARVGVAARVGDSRQAGRVDDGGDALVREPPRTARRESSGTRVRRRNSETIRRRGGARGWEGTSVVEAAFEPKTRDALAPVRPAEPVPSPVLP
jgi:hypothetical protein